MTVICCFWSVVSVKRDTVLSNDLAAEISGPHPVWFLLSRSAIGESVFRLSVAPADGPGFPKLVTLTEKGGGGSVENIVRRFTDIARTLSSKTSTRQGNYQWWSVRPRRGLRSEVVYIELFFFRGLFVCYWYAGPPWRPWGPRWLIGADDGESSIIDFEIIWIWFNVIQNSGHICVILCFYIL
jgi:hypothetical protein